MNAHLVDSSVALKWLRTTTAGESEVEAAESLRRGHFSGVTTLRMLDLGVYELSNVLIRRRRWPAREAAEQIEDLLTIVGPPVPLESVWLGDALALAEAHGLSGYDAHWAAAARYLKIPLVSADRALLDSGLAESATDAVRRLGLTA